MPPVRPSARGARHHPVAAAARPAASLAQPAGSRQLSSCGQLTGTGSETSSGHASTRHLTLERSTRDGSSAGFHHAASARGRGGPASVPVACSSRECAREFAMPACCSARGGEQHSRLPKEGEDEKRGGKFRHEEVCRFTPFGLLAIIVRPSARRPRPGNLAALSHPREAG